MQILDDYLKSDSHLPKKVGFTCINGRPSKMMKIQGRIQTENGSVQMLWAPKKMSPKMKKRKRKLLFSDKFLK